MLAKKSVDSVVYTFDLLKHTAFHFSKVQYLAIARADQAASLVDDARIRLEAASKELRQVLELGEIVDVTLFQIAAEHP